MNTFEFSRKLAKINEDAIRQIAGESIVEKSDEVLNIIKGQLWDGKTGEGKEITPSYLDDPYFKSKKQALSYAKWKASITKNSDRNFVSPNLFINGFFYDTLKIADNGSNVESNSFGAPIIEKYGHETFVVNAKNDLNKTTIQNIRKSFIEKILQ